MLKVLSARVVRVVKHRQRRKGSALLLVVVLVLLLSMMGTAYMVTVRLSREQLSGTGSGAIALPESDFWPNYANLEIDLSDADASLKSLTQTAMEAAVVNGGVYRNPANPDHIAAEDTEYIADRAPYQESGRLWWKGITRIPGQQFVNIITGIDPTNPADVPVPPAAIGTVLGSASIRNDQAVDAYRLIYPSDYQPVRGLAGRPRMFPGLEDTAAVLGADADGDGIADSYLMRLTPSTYGMVTDQEGNSRPVTFWGAVRIVDNAGAINVNTARANVDLEPDSTTEITVADDLHAYMGTFRSNVGFYELLTAAAPAGEVPAEPDADLDELDEYRMRITQASATMFDEATPPGVTPRADAEYLTWGDALEHNLARRLANPGYNGDDATQYRAVEGIWEDLLFHNCFVNPKLRDRPIYSLLENSAMRYSPNYALSDGRKFYTYYGANQADFWFHTVHEWDSTIRGDFYDNSPTLENCPVAFTEADVQKTIRHHLVQSNPVSNLIADHESEFNLLPLEIKDASDTDHRMPILTDTPTKACVNTAPFGELWRAYWNVFRLDGGAHPQVRSAARHATAGWTNNEQLITRAAIAAINTLSLRNPQDAPVESRTFTLGGLDVTVYGVKKQPFITEVMAAHDAGSTNATYVAIELYNPYPTPITMNNWRLATLSGGSLTEIQAFSNADTVPANGYVVIEAGVRPVSAPLINVAGATITGDPALLSAVEQEVVLLRPRADNGTLDTDGEPGHPFDESNLYDLVPVDQVNLTRDALDAAVAERHIYSRHNGFAAVRAGDTGLPALTRDNAAAGSLGAANTAFTVTSNMPIPLANSYSPLGILDAGGAGNENVFPFSGFARDGDILHVPFIGHYRITPAGNHAFINELNAVTVDAIFADDNDAGTDTVEQIGRFCPLTSLEPGYGSETYGWASRIFDYLTALPNPGQDFTPNVDGGRYTAAGNPQPEPTATLGGPVSDANTSDEERRVGIEGRININTAPVQVLAALPLARIGDPGIGDETAAATQRMVLARAIVNDRNTNGPFESVFDLNRVPGFQDQPGPTTDNYGYDQGDLSPNDGVTDDYESRMLALTRISNLITTRSDSFTCYYLVQAWMDAGTSHPVLIREHRSIQVIDRSKLSKVTNSIPNDDVVDVANE